jgi:uncharacterized membrane protein
MLLTYDALLWLLVAFHVVGAAALFLRLFPDESPWLAFLLPALGLVVVLNFIEHLVALPTLAWLLPFTLVAFSRSLLRPGVPWRALGVPTALLLLAFAFNFAVKCLHPGIPPDDSMADLNRVLDFSLGDKLPPTDSWLPPFDHRWYYTFQHYAASVVERLFALNLGTACNVSFTLLNALIGFAGAGIAYLMGGRRTWSRWPSWKPASTARCPWCGWRRTTSISTTRPTSIQAGAITIPRPFTKSWAPGPITPCRWSRRASGSGRGNITPIFPAFC